MSLDVLTEDVMIKTFRNFFREKPFIVFGTGMSCALDDRFGMTSLKDKLIDEMASRSLLGEQADEWSCVKRSLKDGKDLESALDEVGNQDLLKAITEITGAFVASIDREYAYGIATGSAEWPAIHLFKKIVDTLPEGDPILHCLTPNYDMLFEYACDYTGIPYADGFFGCMERKMDWDAVKRSLLEPMQVRHSRKLRTIYKYRKHIQLYKVHGSLNYFFHRNTVIENNAWMWDPPDFAQRVLITPGLSKYEKLQHYRQELLKAADTAIDKATNFLFLGYGFNDSHIEEYIKRKLVAQSCHGLIVTQDSNRRIERLLAEATNLWLVCKSEDATSEGTRIFNKQYSNWLSIPGKRLWDIREFTTEILGG